MKDTVLFEAVANSFAKPFLVSPAHDKWIIPVITNIGTAKFCVISNKTIPVKRYITRSIKKALDAYNKF